MKLSGWLLVLVVVPSVLFAQTNGDFPSGAHQAVRCMLAHNSPEDCTSLPKVIVPSYLLQEYHGGPSSLHEALQEHTLAQLSEDQVANIPLSLLYLVPRARLADLKVNQLKAMLQKHAGDTSLVHQVAACLHHGNEMLKFIKKMDISLPEKSLQVLAESVEITDLTEDFFILPFIEKEPLLAYLRPAVLFNAETSILYTIFNVLKFTESNPPKKSAFYFLAETAIRHRVPLSKLRNFVMGLSSDQLLNESLSFDHSVTDFRLDLSILQARALFERTYQNTTLSSSNFIDSKPLLFKLSPELLQKFPQNVHKYDVSYIEPPASIPLPTACQITEYVKADCILTRRFPKNTDKFRDIHIRHLGKWVYTLPLSAIEGYKTSILSTAVLRTLESPALTPMQAYYLSGKGEALDVMTPNSVLELETFLHALPASQLVNRKLGEIIFHVKLHLVSKLPANNLPRTLSLVNKIASSIGDPADVAADDNSGDSSVLEELLGNKDVNQIMALLSPKDLALSAEAILKLFAENRIRNSFGQTIEQLPQQILAALLDYDRQKNPSQWRWSRFLERSQVSHLLVGGLTCKDIEDMDTGLFIPIISRYNAARKKSFPKNLQHCCLQKLISHLKLKMTLTQTDPDLGLISLLEPIEIESIGGYVLVNIPLDAMQVSPYLGHILSRIGQLSSAELLLSTDISRLKLIAELAVDKEGNVNTFLVRNLVWFLPPNATTPDLRLMLEARLLDTTVCQSTEDRRYTATRLISVFGSPEQWSAGVLATMQDLLIVFTDEELSKISQSSWTEAADSFTSHYDDLVDWIQPSAFYKVCSKILENSEENDYKNAIGRYVRWRLKAAQWLFDTVVPIPQPDVTKPSSLYTHDQFVNQDKESKAPLEVFDPQVEMEPFSEEADESEYEDIEDNEETALVDTSSTEESTTEESTTEKSPTTEESTTEESTTEKSTTDKSTSEKITTEKSTSTEKYTTDKGISEESTTEKSPTTEKSITEESTIEKNTTDKSTSEKITTKKSTRTEKNTSDKSIYEESTTEKSLTTKKSTTEEITTEKNMTDKSTSEKITTEKSTRTEKNTTDKSISEESTPKRDSSTDKSLVYQNVSEDNVTQKNSSTEKMFWETGRNITTEATITAQINEGKVSILNSTIQKPTTLNITSTSIKHYISRGNNVTVKISGSLFENTTNFKNLPSCINLVNKEECQNDTGDEGPNKPSTEMSVNEITHSNNETSRKVYPKTTPPVFYKTSSFSFENQLKNSSFQNSSLTPGKIPATGNQSEDKTTAVRVNSVVTPLAIENHHDNSSEMLPPSHKPYQNLSPTGSSINKTSTIQSSKKNYTFDDHSQNSFSDYTNITNPENNLPKEDYAGEEEYEEKNTNDTLDKDDFGILTGASRREKRSVIQSTDFKLSCNAIKMVGNLAELTLTTLDLDKMSAIDVADCRMEFANMDLSEAVQKIIWKKIENELKLDGIHLLGRLLRVVSVADLWDIDFRASDPWVLETIHAIIQYNNNTMVIKKLMQEVVKYNAEFSVDLLAVLGPAVCSLEPGSLRALSVIGLDLGSSCPSCLPYLALRATEELRSVDSWTPHFVHSLQAIVAGLDLDNWKILAASNLKPLTGLQPSAAKCLNTSHLEVLSPEQIRMIPVGTLLSFSEHQSAALNLTQLEAVKSITQPSITGKMTPSKPVHVAGFPTGYSNKILPTVWIITIISILNLLKSL